MHERANLHLFLIKKDFSSVCNVIFTDFQGIKTHYLLQGEIP